MKTQYLTVPHPLRLKLWRFKDNQLEYFGWDNEWKPSHYTLAGHGTMANTKWIKIGRDKARKLEPKAF